MNLNRVKPSWSTLPNEIQFMIVRHMDIQTCYEFAKCGFHEAVLVNLLRKFDVNVLLKYEKPIDGTPHMDIILKDEETDKIQLAWRVTVFSRNREPRILNNTSSTVVYSNFSHFQTSNKWRATPLDMATSIILRRIFNNPIFVVKQLEIQLSDFDGKIDIGSKVFNIDRLVISNFTSACDGKFVIYDFLVHRNFKFKSMAVRSIEDSRWLGEALYIMHTHVHNLYPFIQNIWLLYQNLIHYDSSRITTFEGAHRSVVSFLSLVEPFKNMMDREEIREIIESTDTIDEFIYFRVAYWPPWNDAPSYLQTADPQYENKVAFLRDGMEDYYLNYHQLSTLSVVYICRLLRDQPEVQEVMDDMYHCFRLVLEERRELQFYEKFIDKIEKLALEYE